jgi:hypothetical protein
LLLELFSSCFLDDLVDPIQGITYHISILELVGNAEQRRYWRLVKEIEKEIQFTFVIFLLAKQHVSCVVGVAS